jgi:hypothetical protein
MTREQDHVQHIAVDDHLRITRTCRPLVVQMLLLPAAPCWLLLPRQMACLVLLLSGWPAAPLWLHQAARCACPCGPLQ